MDLVRPLAFVLEFRRSDWMWRAWTSAYMLIRARHGLAFDRIGNGGIHHQLGQSRRAFIQSVDGRANCFVVLARFGFF